MLFDLARVDAGASPAAFDSVLGKEGKLQICLARTRIFRPAFHSPSTLFEH
jgi:hypothetical protein